MEEYIYEMLGSKRRRKKVVLYIILALVLAVMMIPTKIVLAKMLPGKSANTFSVYVDTATNSSISETKKVTDCVVNYFKKEPSVHDMEVYLGQGAPLDYAGLVKGSALKQMKNQAEIVVNLTDKHSRDEPSYSLVHRVRKELQFECIAHKKGTTIKFVEMPSGPPTLATVVINLFGTDATLMRSTAKTISEVLTQTEGLVDVDIMQDDIYPKYEIIPDKEKIIRSGLSVEQVNNILYLAFKGMIVAVKNSKMQQDQIPIFVRLNDESRSIFPNTREGFILETVAFKTDES
ncbi:MAG: efflux RND transporter permease subunit [Sulfurimonas sp.]|nr:efflux RND transporter permease subunit [Sulfurimonas sp.]